MGLNIEEYNKPFGENTKSIMQKIFCKVQSIFKPNLDLGLPRIGVYLRRIKENCEKPPTISTLRYCLISKF